ncbi:hypothetical protein MAQ5080_02287 [Marinomonas aquimarina]|uniref:DUF2061 domain-containing protein n=1 Tax=Marinomonas aquimarina TaxID=295068 RepID=A0A1A8TGC9_9GAMM|nr:DUF2061 domain-containing protein [Marinomonas aquimarina]SBS32525.1 hypothetical protein MAQ5080_02287 [Marinomonas aquimarina]
MAKTTTFAVMHFAVAFSVAYVITGSFLVGGLVAMIEPAINTVAYYFHEQVWQRLEAGRWPSLPRSVRQSLESFALRS